MAISVKGAHFPQDRMRMGVRWYLTRTRPMVGCKAFEATQATLTGIERMHRLKKKQTVIEARDEGLTAAALFDALAA